MNAEPDKRPIERLAAVKKYKDMTIQNKLFRKAFYENSQPFSDMLIFAEISDKRLAKKVGIHKADQVVVCQNKNEFSELPFKFNLVNLECEHSSPIESLTQVGKITDELKDSFTEEEITQMLMFSDDPDINVFQKFLIELQNTVYSDKLIYGQTKNGLKVMRDLFQHQQKDVLFVGLRDSKEFDV